jgi:hypothetical protein
LLALLPLMQTCFRMVRLRCSPANPAREIGSAATPSQRLLPFRRRFPDSSQISGRARTDAAFDLRADFFADWVRCIPATPAGQGRVPLAPACAARGPAQESRWDPKNPEEDPKNLEEDP